MTLKDGSLMTNCLITIIKSQLTRPYSTDLLQGCSAQLDGDVCEEAVSLCAEISDDVRVCVRLSEELHLTFCYLKTLWQYSFHGYVASIKFTPKVTNTECHNILYTALYVPQSNVVYLRDSVVCC